MECLNLIKGLRQKLGMTQSELSQRSKISLPFIQELEAGRANPSIATIQSIYQVFGLKIQIDCLEPDWNEFSRLGAPLSAATRSSTRKLAKPNAELLIEQIRKACVFLSQTNDPNKYQRECEATQALLLALKYHYRSIYSSAFRRSSLIENFVQRPTSGRIIKLRRIAIANISEYL